MPSNHDDQLTIREYLLFQLDEDSRNDFEQRLLTDDGLFEELLVGEDELIDEYLAGNLNGQEIESFEKNFLATAERQEKLRFARAFKKYGTLNARRPQTAAPISSSSLTRFWQQIHSPSPWTVAAVAALILVAALGVWRIYFYQSDVDKGLIALNAAYRQERPVEARITKLDYAPYVTTRGGESGRFDPLERDVAERYLLDAVRNHPDAASYHALGKFYLAEGNFDKAIAEFEEALKTEPKNAQIYADLGAAFLERGKIELEKGVAQQNNPDDVLARNSDAGKGIEEIGHSLENLTKALELDPNLLEALFNRALCYQYMMLPQQAADAWKKYLQQDSTSAWAAEARRNLQLIEGRQANTLGTRGRLLEEFLGAYESGDDQLAWTALNQSRTRGGNLIVDQYLDEYLNLAANGNTVAANEKLKLLFYAAHIELAKAGDRYTSDVVNFYDRSSKHEREGLAGARAQIKAGGERFNKGEFDEAIDLFSKAHNSFTRIGEPAEGFFAESWVGYARLRIPQTEQSIALFQRVARDCSARNYKALKALSLNALADATLSANEYSQALGYANECLKLSTEISDPGNQIRCFLQSQSLQLIVGDYRQSLDSMRSAIRIAESLPSDPKLIWPLYHEATLAAHFLNLPKSALAFELEALRLADAANVPLLRSRSWERLGLIYGAQKNYEEALRSGESAFAEAQSISSELSRKNVAAHSMLMLGRLNREAGNFQKSLDCFNQSLALYQDLHFDAYRYSAHKGKFLALNGLNQTASAATELPTLLALFEDAREKIAEESNRDKFFDAGQETYDLAADFEFSRVGDVKQAFNYAEASRARSLFEMMTTGAQFASNLRGPELKIASEAKPLTLLEIQQRMPEQTQILEYAVLDDKVLIWVINKALFVGKAAPIGAVELARKIRVFNDSILGGQPSHEAFLDHAKELHDWLVSPIAGFLKKDLQLFIMADKSLNYLPFAALLSPSSGRYLIEDYQLEMSPSATVFIKCCDEARSRSTAAKEQLLSVGNPRFDRTEFRSLPDLPAATREAREIAAFYSPATLLVEGQATMEPVKRGLMKADVIHLATHAVSNERSPLLSKLLLAAADKDAFSAETDDTLSAAEIYQLKLPRARLVVLSACQTGIELAYRGEGAIGLARPFLAARVPLVVASLWPVESEVTADLMVQFHRYRKEYKLTTAAALQKAQLDMLHNPQPAFRVNMGWSAFTVIGGYAEF